MICISPLLLGLCACVVFVGTCLSLVCLWGCLGIMWGGCGGCRNCDARDTVCEGCDILRECEVDGNAGVMDGWGMVAVSEGCEHMVDTCIVSSADNVLEMSLVRGVRGVGEVCECVWVWLGEGREVRGWEVWVWGLAFLLDQGECGTCVCVWVMEGVGRKELGICPGVGFRNVGGVMSVWVVSLVSLCWWQFQISIYCASRIPAHIMCTQC